MTETFANLWAAIKAAPAIRIAGLGMVAVFVAGMTVAGLLGGFSARELTPRVQSLEDSLARVRATQLRTRAAMDSLGMALDSASVDRLELYAGNRYLICLFRRSIRGESINICDELREIYPSLEALIRLPIDGGG